MGQFMMLGAKAHAKWELQMSRNILSDRKRVFILGLFLIPIVLGGVAFADQLANAASEYLPDVLGGKKAYSPAFYTTGIFVASILIGLCAGLITGCIGAGGGFIIAPALMSAGIKGILAVGTDLFHIFAKAIMGSIIHRKLGNVSVSLAATFLIGAIGGATGGGLLNRLLYEINPVLSDAFITTIYAVMLGGLGAYAMLDFLKARKTADPSAGAHGGGEGADIGGLPKKIQAMNIPPMIRFDQNLVPGGRAISAWFLIASGFVVGLAAGIMGVGGGFPHLPHLRLHPGRKLHDHGGNRYLPDRVHRGLCGHQPIRHLRLHLLHPGHGHAPSARFWASRSAPWSPRWCRASPSADFTPWRCWPAS